MAKSHSQTNISEYEGHHYWTIRNWKSWIGCSEKDATLHSDRFCIPIVNDDGLEEKTFWMMKAFPKKNSASGKDMLAFRLISLNEKVPKGSFHLKTVAKSLFGRESVVSKFKPLPLDAAYHWMTCIRYHTSDDLTVKIKIKIVSSAAPPMPALVTKKPSLISRFFRIISDYEGLPRHPLGTRYVGFTSL